MLIQDNKVKIHGNLYFNFESAIAFTYEYISGYLMRRSMHKTFQIICLTTLALYLVTLAAVPYVGVYLTYGAIPIIVISGLLTYWLAPKEPGVLVEKTDQERILEIEARLKDLEG